MHEPKYKLNQKDRAKFEELARQEALESITPAGRAELEKLARKRRRKLWSHPKMQAIRRRNYNADRKLKRLAAKLEKFALHYLEIRSKRQ